MGRRWRDVRARFDRGKGCAKEAAGSGKGCSHMLKIEQIIKKDWKQYTASEQKLATFFLQHLQDLPFETAASIAKRLSMSPMTVGRFIKKLGYDDLKAVNKALRAEIPGKWLAGRADREDAVRRRAAEREDQGDHRHSRAFAIGGMAGDRAASRDGHQGQCRKLSPRQVRRHRLCVGAAGASPECLLRRWQRRRLYRRVDRCGRAQLSRPD